MVKHILSSKVLSQLMFIPKMDEPDSKSLLDISGSGVFIGNSYTYSMPVLIDFGKLLNPHILIVGMTGSGKTFLMKNTVLRLSIIEGSMIILIDFTGEYQNSLKMSVTSMGDSKGWNYKENEIIYFNLSGKSEPEKIKAACEILENSLKLMRRCEIDGNKRIFIVLDEAWKLLRSEKSLEIIVREGRKYGVGLILSSQLIEDADNTIISNIATLFLFRTQNKKSIEKIAKNYSIPENYIDKIQNLTLGSCLVVQIYKSNVRSAFLIKRVIGLQFKEIIKIKIDGNMGIEITSGELDKLLDKLCAGKHELLSNSIKQQSGIALNDLIKAILTIGADKKEILREFKKLGLDDFTLSDSFSFAICELSDQNERK